MPVTSGMEFVIAHYAVIIIDASACCVKAGRWEVERLSSCVLTKENPGSIKRYCLLKMSSARSRSWVEAGPPVCARVCVCAHVCVCMCGSCTLSTTGLEGHQSQIKPEDAWSPYWLCESQPQALIALWWWNPFSVAGLLCLLLGVRQSAGLSSLSVEAHLVVSAGGIWHEWSPSVYPCH